MVTAVVLELEVDLLLADQVKLTAVGECLELGVLIFQITDTGTEFFNFAGISEVNIDMESLLFHLSQHTARHNRVNRDIRNKHNRSKYSNIRSRYRSIWDFLARHSADSYQRPYSIPPIF